MPPSRVPRDERAAYYDEMNRVIAALHAVDPAAVGLGDYGRPGNYFERQITRWTRQYEGRAGRARPDMDALVAWLPTPFRRAMRPRVHGDFRCDNMIFHPPSRAFWRCWTGNCPRWAIRWPISPITR
jgi:aminoglycoside phosphotransferase (APT) family kinase protein